MGRRHASSAWGRPWRPGIAVVGILLGALFAGYFAAGPAVMAASSGQTSGCPERIGSAANLRGPTGNGIVKVAGLRSARVCRFYGDPPYGVAVGEKPIGGRLAGSRWLSQVDAVRSLASLVNRLHPYSDKALEEEPLCGEDSKAGAYVMFRYSSGRHSSVTVHASGCPNVTDGRDLYMLSDTLWRRIVLLVPLESERNG